MDKNNTKRYYAPQKTYPSYCKITEIDEHIDDTFSGIILDYDQSSDIYNSRKRNTYEGYTYIEINSSSRNRNEYPNPLSFGVPVNTLGGDTGNLFIDPILSTAPYSGSTLPINDNVTGISTSNTTITLNSSEPNIDGFYNGYTLVINSEYHSILSYKNRIATVETGYPTIPPSGTPYTIIALQSYFNSAVGIANVNNFGMVTEITLLNNSPSLIKNIYVGDFFVWENGVDRTDQLGVITSYTPNPGNLSWLQSSNPGYNSYLSTTTPEGFGFRISRFGQISQLNITLTSFETVSPGRSLLLSILSGKGVTGTLLYSDTYTVSNVNTPTQINLSINAGPVLNSATDYTLTLLDTTSGGTVTGYINLFGITTNSSFVSYNTAVYPQVSIGVSTSSIILYQQPIENGFSAYINTVTPYGYSFISGITTNLTRMTIILGSYEGISSGRTLTYSLINGNGLSGATLYTNTTSISNSFNAMITLNFTSIPVISGNYYTLSLKDTTTGGIVTGFIRVIGINSNSTFTSYNTNVYPQLSVYGPDSESVIVEQLNDGDNRVIQLDTVEKGYVFTAINTNIFNNLLLNYTSFIYPLGNRSVTMNLRVGNGLNSSIVYTANLSIPNSGGSRIDTIFNLSSSYQIISGIEYTISFIDSQNIFSGWVELYGISTDSNSYLTTGATQTNKLVPNNEIGISQFGNDLSMSFDGNNLLVGAVNDNNGVGAVWLYTRLNNVWTQNIKITPTDIIGIANIGVNVAISGDGKVIAFGGTRDNTFAGAIWVYDNLGNEISKIVPNDTIGNAEIGSSVSLSKDGTILAFGGLKDNNGVGAVWVYKNVNGTWTEEIKIIPSYLGANPYIGSSLSMSGDGNTLAIGGSFDNSGIGAVWIYNFSTMWNFNSKLVGSGYLNYAGSSGQGVACSLSNDGTILVIGAPYDDNYIGGFWIFQYISSNWVQIGNKYVGSGGSGGHSLQGTSVCVSLNGTTIASGGINDNAQVGAVWLYTLDSNGQWTQFGNKLVGNNIGNSLQGQVCLNNEGQLLAVGGASDNSQVGADWIYTVNNTYPRIILSSGSIPGTVFSQTSNQTITTIVNTTSEMGFRFSSSVAGFINIVKIALTSFDTSNTRTLRIQIRKGGGVVGTSIYSNTFDIPDINSRVLYQFTLGSGLLSANTVYTMTLQDISASASGGIYIYGINHTSKYVSYNTNVYPYLSINIPSYIIQYSPAQPLSSFFNDGSDTINFNKTVSENATALYTHPLGITNETTYDIILQYITFPNQILGKGYGGNLFSYPYFYVAIYNEGNNLNTNVLISNKYNISSVLFKVKIDSYYLNHPYNSRSGKKGYFYTFAGDNRPQRIKIRPDQALIVSLMLPNGQIMSTQAIDNLSPSAPNPLLQMNILFGVKLVT